jgi:hypothetical protein
MWLSGPGYQTAVFDTLESRGTVMNEKMVTKYLPDMKFQKVSSVIRVVNGIAQYRRSVWGGFSSYAWSKFQSVLDLIMYDSNELSDSE